MKMFQTRFGNLLCSDLDACVLCVRNETTRMLVRKEWTFMTNSENLQKILNMRCSHHTKHAERNTLRHLPCETLSSSGATNSEDGAMEFVTTRFATSYVDASFDRGSRELE